jgi:hypothetical protein
MKRLYWALTRKRNDMDRLITIIERGAEDMQGIATVMARPSRGSRVTGNISNTTTVAAAMPADLISIVIPLAK